MRRKSPASWSRSTAPRAARESSLSRRRSVVKQNGSYAENGDGEFAAGYLAGFLKDILDDASPTTWAPHHSSHAKMILDFLKGDLTGLQEDTLWRRAKLYNTFAKLQK